MTKKQATVDLSDVNGNWVPVIHRTKRALQDTERWDQVIQYQDEVRWAESFDEVMQISLKYVTQRRE